ncbi:MAG: hypothetical protein ATN35_06380 [Epulopiscium sp. Nele67-Bin004]|nr:MAG: hypothetical protein ATN35_06380 [Epulopiscium sp. Nele67-Bin004]
MKPIKLVMTAFGPYAEAQTIDFTELGQHNIFVITGPTGAGKTTIFDAMSYALFATGSGETRDYQQNFRSNFVDDKQAMSVEFTFEVSNRRYIVTKRLTPKAKSATTKLEDITQQKVITSGVAKEVENILGINEQQFKQIVMLPQGEFRKFLNSDTTEKSKIFRSIFGTYLFEQIQEAFKQRAKGLKDTHGQLENELYILRERYASQAQGDILDFKKVVVSQETQLTQYATDIQTLDNLISTLTEQKVSIDTANKRLQEIQKQIEQLEQSIKKGNTFKTEKQNDLSKTSQQFTDIKEKLTNHDELKKEKNKLEEVIPKFEQQEVLTTQLCEAEQHKLLIQKQELENSRKQIGSLYTMSNNYDKNIAEHTKKADSYKKLEQSYNKVRTEYEDQNNIYRDEQAGILATTLQEGEPCIVCGSTTHPNPAKVSAEIEVLSKDELQKLQDKILPAEQAKNKAYDELQVLHQNNIVALERITAELEKYDNLPSEYTSNLTKEVTIIGKQLQQQIAKLGEKITITQVPNGLTQQDIEIRIAQINTELIAIQKDIPNISKAEVSRRITNISRQIIEEEQQYTKIETAINDIKKNIIQADTKIVELNNQLEQTQAQLTVQQEQNAKNKDILDVMAELGITTTKRNQLLNEQQSVVSSRDIIKEIGTQFEKANKNYQQVEKEYRLIGDISDIANGKGTYVTYENYVLGMYFDQVIDRANVRLAKMTANRYSLRRQDSKDGKGAGQRGLDIEVYDEYTSKIRDAKTLSGGEGFKASLALALGLSDVIQENSGGIHLDMMFIDEGFGTLDPQSLDSAVDTLVDLQVGGRLIGVISHVEELKERIGAKLEVYSSTTGSTTKFVVN